jgi:hypothetical protein
MFAHAFYVDAEGFMLPDLVTLGGTFGDGDEQILNFFVVDFHHGDHDFVLPVFIVVGCDAVEDLFAGDGDDSLVGSVSDHGIGLAGACLTVGEETAVIALPCIFQNFDAYLFEYESLICVFLGVGDEVASFVDIELVMGPE